MPTPSQAPSSREIRRAPAATILRARAERREMSPQERRLWQALRRLRADGFQFRRKAPLLGGIVDFACLRARLVVEVDAAADQGPSPADQARDDALAQAGFRVLRFFAIEIDRDLPGVMRTIMGRLGGG
ncbi:endonuclease domain-containing protein [Salinarimonas sp.]|uniref:endonuclease domain-containing protein n=1 Tax=Salinarimonas sp. TaxID=2766526 RepID=UPI0032D96769